MEGGEVSERQQTQIKLFILISRKCGHEAQTSIYVEFSMAKWQTKTDFTMDSGESEGRTVRPR